MERLRENGGNTSGQAPHLPYAMGMTESPADPPDVDTDTFLSRLWQLGPAMVLGAPHSKHLGMRFVSVDLARASLALDYSPDIVGDPKTRVMHGGAVTTLLDQCSGLAAIAGLQRPVSVATLNLHIDYQRASPPGETVIAVAHAYKVTRHVAFIRGIAHNGDEDDPVATSQATFMVTGEVKGIGL